MFLFFLKAHITNNCLKNGTFCFQICFNNNPFPTHCLVSHLLAVLFARLYRVRYLITFMKTCYFWASEYKFVSLTPVLGNDRSGTRICCVVIVVLISNTILCRAEDSVHSQIVWKLLRNWINNNNGNEHSCYIVLTIDQAVQRTIQYFIHIF